MKKIIILFGFLGSVLLFSCKKDTLDSIPAPDKAATAKSDTTIINNTGTSKSVNGTAKTMASVGTDDTKTLQTQLDAGNVTLTSGKVYNVTGVSVSHTLNMNGATINMTATTGAAVRLTTSGAIVEYGTVTGPWSNTTAGNPSSGGTGMQIAANNCSIKNVDVKSFSAYGIVAGPVNGISVTYCHITNTGYLGFFYDAETVNTSGGTFSNNTVDRSMLPASAMIESAAAIRGSNSNPNITTSNWTISNNTFKMPSSPAQATNECLEVRYMTNSTVSNNTFTAGSIGCSVVRSSGITVDGNKFSGSSLEAIEFADSNTSTSQNNVISSSLNVGILVDGSVGSNGITMNNDNISGTAKDCIHTYTNTQNVTVTGCTLTPPAGSMALNLQGTNYVKVSNTTFNGNSVATAAVLLDTCPGNLTITGGSISNFKSYVVSIYSAKAGLVTNNVTMSTVKVAGVPKALNTVVQNGASVGSNIVVVNQ